MRNYYISPFKITWIMPDMKINPKTIELFSFRIKKISVHTAEFSAVYYAIAGDVCLFVQSIFLGPPIR